MEAYVQIAKEVEPGSLPFLLLGMLAGLVLLHRGTRAARWGRVWLMLLLAGYWLFSTPFGYGLLVAGLDRGYSSITTLDQARGADAVVILAGGSLTYKLDRFTLTELGVPSAPRALETARVYSVLGNPWIIVPGGTSDLQPGEQPVSETIRDALVRLGVTPDRILLESRSTNTRGEALGVLPILKEHGIERFVLVTSPAHMWRSMMTFRASGLDPVPSVAAGSSSRLDSYPTFWPRDDVRLSSLSLIYEYMGIAYYWYRGWL